MKGVPGTPSSKQSISVKTTVPTMSQLKINGDDDLQGAIGKASISAEGGDVYSAGVGASDLNNLQICDRAQKFLNGSLTYTAYDGQVLTLDQVTKAQEEEVRKITSLLPHDTNKFGPFFIKSIVSIPFHGMGNFGEMVSDLYMKQQGYIPLHYNPVISLNEPMGQGIDGAYIKASGNFELCIVETKFNKAGLNKKTKTGKQMSFRWILARLQVAMGPECALHLFKKRHDTPFTVFAIVIRVKVDNQKEYAHIESVRPLFGADKGN